MKAIRRLARFSHTLRILGFSSVLMILLRVPLGAHQGAAPVSAQQAGPLANVQQLVLPPTDPQAELASDSQKFVPGPLRFAVARKVQVTPATDGTWEQLPNGRLWRLRILSPGATDLNLGFTTYWMPEGATLHLISESQDFYQGPYTSEHNAEHGQLWTAVVPGEAAVLELFVPNGVEQDPTLVLTQVSTGYRDLFKVQKGLSFPKGDTCEIDVVCPQAAPWTNEIRSVALISIGGLDFCTATLVMDAAGDFRPFLLTANHCDIGPANASTVVAYWNFQSTTCGAHGTGLPDLRSDPTAWSQTTSGSSFRAAREDIDFCLIELTRTPSSAYAVYYAGWDRSGNASSSVVGIHHPQAQGKCISFSNGGLTTTDSCIGTGGTNTHWRVPWSAATGVTEQGSSGSGIWDTSTHKIVGTLSGGPYLDCSADPADLWDCYGKFALAWQTGGFAAERLRDWLDPCNTGLMSKAGAYPAPGAAIVAAEATLISEGCVPTNGVVDPGETVTVSFAVKNMGTLPTTANLVGILQAGNGVLASTGPQTYGVVAANGAPVSRSFSFTAVGNCGDTITPTLQLQDGNNNYCASFSFVLGKLSSGTLENFDTTDLWALPAGWSEDPVGLTWYVQNSVSDTPPNAAYTYDPITISDRRLFSPIIPITSPNAQFSFRHNYDVEDGYDGCVLEISIGGGAPVDIQSAGGSFVTGGYNKAIAIGYGNPIAGRAAWSGTSGSFITTTVNLPASAAGQNVQLCWRLASDDNFPGSTQGAGWYVDTISLANGYQCCTSSAVPATLSSATYTGGQFQFMVTGTPGSRYAVQGSTDLVTWVPLQTNASPFTYIESDPSKVPTRFYRAVSQP